ncbi:MAG TPA: dihydrodipicolinate synthase family protein [Puia sp.]
MKVHTNKKYRGVIVPAVTPLKEDFELDESGVERLFALFRQHGVLPFIMGTTGEAASLPVRMKQQYIRVAARLKHPGELLYAGIASNCLEETAELGRFCFREGVDVVVAHLPSYFGLAPAQMKKYFQLLADEVGGPLIIYNIPSTTHQSIPLEVIDELSRHRNIVGIKDSERDEERLKRSLQLWSARPDFSHFLGWAARSSFSLLNGGDGLVPSTANLYPGIYREMLEAAEKGDVPRLNQLQEESDKMGALYQGRATIGESFAALKALMSKEGICQRYMMPPL